MAARSSGVLTAAQPDSRRSRAWVSSVAGSVATAKVVVRAGLGWRAQQAGVQSASLVAEPYAMGGDRVQLQFLGRA